jgi:hypothetical protein
LGWALKPGQPTRAVRWDPHFAQKYQRISKRRGEAKAIVAVAREMAVAMYHMLTRKGAASLRKRRICKEKV